MSPQKARLIRWNLPDLIQHIAYRLLTKITEQPDSFIRNDNGKAVVDGDIILGSNFKSLFK